MLVRRFLALAPFVATYTSAAPLFGINFGEGSEANGTPTPISEDTVTNDLLTPALFSRTAYCTPDVISNWSCGAPCQALPGVTVFTAGGDDADIPFYFVANDPASQSIVVAHEGTDPTQLLSDLNDIEIAQVPINTTLFPSATSGTLVHDGFLATQGRTADTILSTVQSALASTGYTNVLVTGHSLGAAIASLDAVMLKMALPSTVNVESVVFGLPRVGNQDWANLVDSMFPTFTHVTNQEDPVPIVPPQVLNFQQPSGEAHITAVDSSGNSAIEQCPGQENQLCSDANSLLEASIINHLGPYFSGISFGTLACPL